MRMHRFQNAGTSRGAAAGQEDHLGRDRSSSVAAGRKDPIAWTLDAPVSAEEFQELRGQQSLPVFASLALPHPEHVPAGVNVARLELGYLRNTEPAAIEDRQCNAIATFGRGFQERLDF